jgi:hypothetical protein
MAGDVRVEIDEAIGLCRPKPLTPHLGARAVAKRRAKGGRGGQPAQRIGDVGGEGGGVGDRHRMPQASSTIQPGPPRSAVTTGRPWRIAS